MQLSPTLYFDRSLGKDFPEALRLLKLPNIIHHNSPPELAGLKGRAGQRQLFAPNAPDDEWLEFVGRRGWIAFTQDYRIHREAAPLAAIKDHGVKVFYLWGAQASRWDKMCSFAAAYPRILSEAAAHNGPFVRVVTKAGKLEQVEI